MIRNVVNELTKEQRDAILAKTYPGELMLPFLGKRHTARSRWRLAFLHENMPAEEFDNQELFEFDYSQVYNLWLLVKPGRSNGNLMAISNFKAGKSACIRDRLSSNVGECNVCMEKKALVVFQPCVHQKTCRACYAGLADPKKCPACRAVITRMSESAEAAVFR